MINNKLTKSELVYNELYAAITNAEIPPKTKLTVKDLALKHNVSEIPVREALQRLSAEGLLEYVKYSGYVVPSPSIRHLRWLWEIKLGLELFAADLAVDNCTDAVLMELQDNINRSHEEIKNDRFESFESLNKAFHLIIYKSSANPFLVREIDKYWVQTVKIRGPYSFRKRNVHKSIEDHEIMLQALKDKDKELLKKMIRQHREENYQYFINAYNMVQEFLGNDEDTIKA